MGQDPPRIQGSPTRSRLPAVALALYWLALFVATHIPRPPEIEPPVSDKAIHFLAYAGLAALLAATVRAWRGWRLRHMPVLLGLIAAYAAIDELLQIPVGRHGDIYDWIADVAGAAVALTLAGIWFSRRPVRT